MWGYPEAFMPVPGSEYRPAGDAEGLAAAAAGAGHQSAMATRVQEG